MPIINIVSAFRGMHVSPAKHSYAWLPRKSDYPTDRNIHRQTDAGQSDPYVPLCFACDTKRSPFNGNAALHQNGAWQLHNLLWLFSLSEESPVLYGNECNEAVLELNQKAMKSFADAKSHLGIKSLISVSLNSPYLQHREAARHLMLEKSTSYGTKTS